MVLKDTQQAWGPGWIVHSSVHYLAREWNGEQAGRSGGGALQWWLLKEASDHTRPLRKNSPPQQDCSAAMYSPRRLREPQKHDCDKSLAAPERNSDIYLLIQKMKRLNSLTSNMPQAAWQGGPTSHELSRTKKLVSPLEIDPKSQAPLYPKDQSRQLNSNTLWTRVLGDVPVIPYYI